MKRKAYCALGLCSLNLYFGSLRVGGEYVLAVVRVSVIIAKDSFGTEEFFA